MSRFRPYPEIETEVIFSVDDDRMVGPHGMEEGFAAWQAFPHLLVGHCPRSHSFQDRQYKYCGKRDPHYYSMILTGSVFIHRLYLEMFTDTLPEALHSFIDKNMNGEDIIMNDMVADYLKELDIPQCSGLFVNSSTDEIHIKPSTSLLGSLSRYFSKDRASLWQREDHVKKRNDCLNLIVSVYGYMPLIM
ncbi:PREDICTED: exostosin-like 2 [Amphimedon queenslandica]|uniref:Glycosyl transferase 64 domain-containing protein n=1 Tax=Amphimedon queenslandica TaxID=400682 RepID=A0A1X7U442_AMPQE|nr:PREDICTED: exostosin-like 2 [Amphimedon queenslandica]|eukprot:XP_011406139.1 PREDICTED: exostosin-like 2 [Amphimedon queenslandica]